MTADKFLNIFSACLGFIAAIYFAAGVFRMSAEDVWRSVRSFWDTNQHQLQSVAAQRADYIIGRYSLCFPSCRTVPPLIEPSILQPFGCAAAEIAAAREKLELETRKKS